MKNLFNYRWGRALYQVLIGALLLPYRLVALAIAVAAILQAPVSGMSIRDAAEEVWTSVIHAYKQRAYWVKTGEAYTGLPYEFKEELRKALNMEES